MKKLRDQRKNSRLTLCYPIELKTCQPGRFGRASGVTTNLGSRGAYFKTFSWKDFREGGQVEISIQVPHPMHEETDLVHLRMQTVGKVCRLERIVGREALGEDGLALKGIALEFDRLPLYEGALEMYTRLPSEPWS